MILAAGLGTRLRPFTETTPKPLLPLMGVPLLQWTLDFARSAGITRAVINAHHLVPVLKSGASQLDSLGMTIAWSDESQQILGSGGGIAHALRLLPPRFLALNADTVCTFDLEQLLQRHRELGARGVRATLALKAKDKASSYGGITLNGDRVARFRTAEGTHFYVGAMVLEADAFASSPSGDFDLIEGLLAELAQRGSVGYLEVDAPFYDIGSPEQWAQAHFDFMTSGQRIDRVDRLCAEHAPGIWSLKGVQLDSKATAPAFWGLAQAPRGPIGPRAVVYSESSGPPWSEGIWYGRQRVSLSPPEHPKQSRKPGTP